MSARPSVPPIRRGRVENPVFQDTSTPEPAVPAKNRQVMVYLPPGMVADMADVLADSLRRGHRVDRSALVRAAIRMALANPEQLVAEARED